MTSASTVDELAAEILPRARGALQHSPISELRDLRLDAGGCSLRLSGTVSSFYHKQLAQELVRGICRSLHGQNGAGEHVSGDEVEVINTVAVR